MKAILSIIFSLFLFVGYTQDFFEKIKPGKTHWVYKTEDLNNNIGHFGFYADSVKEIGNERIVWFSKRLLSTDFEVDFDFYSNFYRVAGNVLGDAVIENSNSWKFLCMNEDTIKIPKTIANSDSVKVFETFGKEIWVKNFEPTITTQKPNSIDPNTVTFSFFAKGDSVTSIMKSNFDSCLFSFSKKRGIISTSDLFLLPKLLEDTIKNVNFNLLIGSTNQRFGDTLMRNSAVSNFEIGTEFHRSYRYDYQSGSSVHDYCNGYKKSFIRNKWETDSTIHIEETSYFFANCRGHQSGYPPIPYYYKKEEYDTTITTLRKKQFQGILPNSIYILKPWKFEVIKGPNNFGSWYGILTNSNDCESFYGNSLDSLNLNIPLKQKENCDFYGPEKRVGQGLGNVLSRSHNFDPAYYQRTETFALKYIKNSQLELGTIQGLTILEGLKNEFSIFPNPTTGIINISNPEDLTSIQVFNLQGKLVFETQIPQPQINLQNLPNGVYVIHLISPSAVETQKVILEN